MNDIGQTAPNFSKLVDKIKVLDRFQKKAVEKIISTADDQYFDFAESVVSRILTAVDRGECFDYLAKTYLWYTKLLRIEEMHYAQEGKYRYNNYDEVYKKVYSLDDYMFDYVVGLGLTQPLWVNHYKIFRFFLDEFVSLIKDAKIGAEIGVGHGLFHSAALKEASGLSTTLLDVSNTSLNMTRKMILATGLDPERTKPINVDIQKKIPLEDNSLDVLLMGELIEHIQDGPRVLNALSYKMKKNGYCYFSTAANAPAEDHILLFKSIGEIIEVVENCGWNIIKDKSFTLNGMSVTKAEAGGHNINYCAILQVK